MEADLKNNKISEMSPFAEVLLAEEKKINEEFMFNNVFYCIKNIY